MKGSVVDDVVGFGVGTGLEAVVGAAVRSMNGARGTGIISCLFVGSDDGTGVGDGVGGSVGAAVRSMNGASGTGIISCWLVGAVVGRALAPAVGEVVNGTESPGSSNGSASFGSLQQYQQMELILSLYIQYIS